MCLYTINLNSVLKSHSSSIKPHGNFQPEVFPCEVRRTEKCEVFLLLGCSKHPSLFIIAVIISILSIHMYRDRIPYGKIFCPLWTNQGEPMRNIYLVKAVIRIQLYGGQTKNCLMGFPKDPCMPCLLGKARGSRSPPIYAGSEQRDGS